MNNIFTKICSFVQITMLLLLFSTKTNCFHTTGHMVVARIAEIELEGTRMLQQMMNILAIVSPYTKEKDHPFVESAPYPDDIKYVGVKSMNGWHFHDNYVNGKRALTKKEMQEAGLSDAAENIVWATNEAKTVLRNKNLSLVDDRLNKSIYLRLLIHFYGDLHQPLHNVSIVNENFPKGDEGGNKFVIDMPGARDLHTYWDQCLKKYSDIHVPLTKAKFDKIDYIAKSVMKTFPRTSKHIKERLNITSVKEISQESIKLAIDYVYNGIKEGEAPSEEYIERGQNMIDEQLAVAGYRLTDLFKTLFADESVLENHVKQEKKRAKILKSVEVDLE